MSKEEKMLSAFSNILFVKEHIRVSPKDLQSVKADSILSQDILNIIEKYKPYFNKIEEVVEFIDDVRNPYGRRIVKKRYKIIVNKLGFVK